jgi:hypothetical protein
MSKKIDLERFLRLTADDPSEITPVANDRWIAALQSRLGLRLPRTYRQMAARFGFPAFETDRIWFFGNRDDSLEEAIFRDQEIYPALKKNGLIQIGCRYEGSYDPICFDMRKAARGREPPLVWLDHEAILCHRRIHRIEEVAETLPHHVKAYLAQQP